MLRVRFAQAGAFTSATSSGTPRQKCLLEHKRMTGQGLCWNGGQSKL